MEFKFYRLSMMRNLKIRFFTPGIIALCATWGGVCLAQTGTPIAAKWHRTFGDYKATNRDQLFAIQQDGAGNVYGAISTERDSTFADLSIVKLDSQGVKQWEYLFSTEFASNYDYPLFLELGSDNDIYFGATSEISISQPFRHAYIGKLNHNGTAAWTKNLDEILPHHEDFESFFAFTDKATANLYVTYTVRKWLPAGIIKITYFLAIAPDGTVKENYRIPSLAKFLENDAVIAFQDQDALNLRRLLILGYDINAAKVKMALRLVKSNMDSIINVQVPPNLEATLWNYDGYHFFRTDTAGNIYIAQDAYGFLDKAPLSIYKITPSGQLSLFWQAVPDQGLNIQGSDLLLTRDAAYVTGRQTDQNGYGHFFVTKVDLAGNTLKQYRYDYPDQVVRPMRVYGAGKRVYVSFVNRTQNQLNLLAFDQNLAFQRQIGVRTPYFDNVTDLDLFPCSPDAFIYGFNHYLRNYPGSPALSENDVFLKKINAEGSELWSYRYSGLGNSYVGGSIIRTDPENNLYVVTGENRGPAFFGVISPPSEFVIHKYDSSGKLLWRHDLIDVVDIIAGNPDHFVIDQDGSVLLTYPKDNTYHVTKIDEDGLGPTLFSGAVLRVFRSKDGRLAIIERPHIDTTYLSILNSKNELESRAIIKGDPMHVFHLPNSNDVYVYTHDHGIWSTSIKTWYLYKEGQLLWKKDLITANGKQEVLITSATDATGALYYATYWGDNQKSLYRIGIDFQAIDRPLSPPQDFHKIIVLSDNILLLGNETLQVWTRNLQYKHARSFPPTYNTNYHVAGDMLLSSKDSFLNVINQEGILVSRVKNQWISLAIAANANLNDHTIRVYTAWRYSGYLAAGYTWTRQLVAAFDLSVLPTNSTESPDNHTLVSLYPNPAGNMVSITGLPVETLAEVELYQLQSGVLAHAQYITGAEHISTANLAPGAYLWVLRSDTGAILGRGKLIVVH